MTEFCMLAVFAMPLGKSLKIPVCLEKIAPSVLQVFFEIFATTTKICTRGRSTRAHALGFVTDLHGRQKGER